MSEELDQLKATSAEMLKAVKCLYIAVEELVADDVSDKVAAYIDATRACMIKLQTSVEFWKKDSATAWDKCEERRLENEVLVKRVQELEAQLRADPRVL